MKAESVWRREGYALVPWSSEARDALLVLPEGGQCVGNIWVAQNPQQLALYWVLCSIVADGLGEPRQKVSDYLAMRFGIYEQWYDTFGRRHIIPGSINIETMDAVKFRAFMDHAIVAMAEMVGTAPKDVRRAWDDAIRRTI
jgi:hypothetical protein